MNEEYDFRQWFAADAVNTNISYVKNGIVLGNEKKNCLHSYLTELTFLSWGISKMSEKYGTISKTEHEALFTPVRVRVSVCVKKTKNSMKCNLFLRRSEYWIRSSSLFNQKIVRDAAMMMTMIIVIMEL